VFLPKTAKNAKIQTFKSLISRGLFGGKFQVSHTFRVEKIGPQKSRPAASQIERSRSGFAVFQELLKASILAGGKRKLLLPEGTATKYKFTTGLSLAVSLAAIGKDSVSRYLTAANECAEAGLLRTP
jgi:hypothetical protein